MHLCDFSGARGTVVVKALCCKPEGCFSIYLILPTALGIGVYSASNRNEYQNQKNNVSGELVCRADNLTAICEPIV
jgi:hypothetical protein